MAEEWAVPEGDSSSLLDSDPPSNGRQADLEQLIREHNRELVHYIERFLHSRRDAEDIAQEAFCRVFGLMGDPRVHSHVNAYLYKTARNLAIDRLREHRRRDMFLRKQSMLEQAFRGAYHSPSAEQVCLAREEVEALSRAAESLTPKVKAAFVLVRQHGLDYEEAAKRLGVKPHSVRRLVDRAKEILIDAVAQDRSNKRVRK